MQPHRGDIALSGVHMVLDVGFPPMLCVKHTLLIISKHNLANRCTTLRAVTPT